MKTFSWFLALAIPATLGCSDLTKAHFDRSQQTLNTNVENISADLGSLGTRVEKVESKIENLDEGHKLLTVLAGVDPNENVSLAEGVRRREQRLAREKEALKSTGISVVENLEQSEKFVENIRDGIGDEIRQGVRDVFEERERLQQEKEKAAKLEAFEAKERQRTEDERLRRILREENKRQYDDLDESVDKLTTAVRTSSGNLTTTIETEFRKVQHRFDSLGTFEARKQEIEQWLKGILAAARLDPKPGPPPANVQIRYVPLPPFFLSGYRIVLHRHPRWNTVYYQCFQ